MSGSVRGTPRGRTVDFGIPGVGRAEDRFSSNPHRSDRTSSKHTYRTRTPSPSPVMLVGAQKMSLCAQCSRSPGPSENFSALAPTFCGPCSAPNQIASSYAASSIARSLPVFLPTSAGIYLSGGVMVSRVPYASSDCDSLFNETLSRARHSKVRTDGPWLRTARDPVSSNKLNAMSLPRI